jgi:putative hydrolase of the HAD superfamily
MQSSPEHVVCFDLGGVLVRICRSWDEACVQAQLPYRTPELLGSEAYRLRRRDVVERYQRGALVCEAYYAELSDAVGGAYTTAEVEQIHAVWTLQEYPGALELVRALNRIPTVATACLSNTNAAHWRRLVSEDGHAHYPSVLELRHRLASHLLGCAKPDAEIYERAERHFFGATAAKPQRIVFFDDLPENIAAARARGWTAFQVDHTADTVSQMREHLATLGLHT